MKTHNGIIRKLRSQSVVIDAHTPVNLWKSRIFDEEGPAALIAVDSQKEY